MKKLILSLSLLLASLAVMAVPAKRGNWQNLKLANGTEIQAQLVGDEHMHFWRTADGKSYVLREDGTAVPANLTQLRRNATKRRAQLDARRRSPRRVSIGDQTHYRGKKKGLIIMMNFQDKIFQESNTLELYKRIINEEGYSEGDFKGSVADYFKAQSGGLFELDFDVFGPFPADNNCSYYGKNDSDGNDMHPDELVVEALNAVDDEVDFNDYDWDGDGNVDQVFIIYPGKGEADGGATTTIWPHMWYLSETGMEQQLDGVTINTYACSCELSGNGNINGIGTICHEFSHCLGYPDFYDTSYSGWFGMGTFDLMDSGSYNGKGFLPAGYTAYEKWMAGWIEPIVLDKEGVTVESLRPTSQGGEAYIIYNDGHKDEYYILENRQKTGWDARLAGKGLMITHVDFDKTIWEENSPNSKVTSQDVENYPDFTKTNDHMRCTIVHADNDDDSKYWNSTYLTFSKMTEANDLYPNGTNNSLTNTSVPAATLFNKNTDGTKFMNKPVTDITQNSDGTIAFKFLGGSSDPDTPVNPDDPGDPGIIFYESFDQCLGTGGNDGQWVGSIAMSKFTPDHDGWSTKDDKEYGADHCARAGTGKVKGVFFTPAITIDGKAVLKFKTAPWKGDNDLLTIGIDEGDATVTPSQFTMTQEQWSEYTATITGSGTIKIFFQGNGRLFLDEVYVYSGAETPEDPEDPETPEDPEDPDTPATTDTSIVIGPSLVALYSSNKDLDFSEEDELTAWIATGIGKGSVILSRINIVPAGTGVLIKAAKEGFYNLPVSTTTSYYYMNLFAGAPDGATVAPTPTIGGNTYAVLTLATDATTAPGFTRVTEEQVFGNNAAYLLMPVDEASAEAQNVRLNLEFCESNEVTGITSTGNRHWALDNVVYDLQGRRIAIHQVLSAEDNTLKPGLYIVRGKKIIVK